MKKLIVTLSILVVGLTSCSNSDNPTPPASSTVLLRKTITKSYVGSSTNPVEQITTALYSYDGNKVIKITATVGIQSMIDNFYYTNNLPTSDELFSGTNLSVKNIISYDSEMRPISKVTLNYISTSNPGIKTVYVYNTDGTVNYTVYKGDLISQTQANKTGKQYYSNGHLVKDEWSYVYAPTQMYTTINTYDDKNNPSKNTFGYMASMYSSTLNNVLTADNTDYWSHTVTTYQYTYNADGFPTQLTTTQTGLSYPTQPSTTTYFYE